jgi:hypothetical protein
VVCQLAKLIAAGKIIKTNPGIAHRAKLKVQGQHQAQVGIAAPWAFLGIGWDA